MAREMVPVLKRCRSLGLDPLYLGVDKKSNRQSIRGNRKKSEYGNQLREKQKQYENTDFFLWRCMKPDLSAV